MTERAVDGVLVGTAAQIAEGTGETARTLLETPHVKALLIALEPGRELPPHRPGTELVLAVLEGMGQLMTEDHIWSVAAGDLAVVPAGTARGLRCLDGRLLAVGLVTPVPSPTDHDPSTGLEWPAEPEAEDPAELIRGEHRGLVDGVAGLARLAVVASSMDADELKAGLEVAVSFLQDELLPHAQAEERLVYPAVEKVLRARGGATASMALDHRRIADLTSDLARVAASSPWDMDRDAGQRLLMGLSALVTLHFDKEEEVYLPQLGRLGAADRQALVNALRGDPAHSEAS